MNIPRETKKIEAIKRLQTIGIIDSALEQFIEDDTVMVSENPLGILFWLNDAQKEIVTNFEAEYNALVYLVIHCNTNFGELLSILYVSDDKADWGIDEVQIKQGYAFTYTVNLSEPLFSEFGTIAFKPLNGGVIRIS